MGKATKTIVHYYYREWKNGVTGEGDKHIKLEQLQLHVGQWEALVRTGRNFVALGDANLCVLSWNYQNYKHNDLSSEVQRFLIPESCFQLVNKFTRVQSVSGILQRSCLDLTTNVPEKCNVPEVLPSGSSDHMLVMVTKLSPEVKTQPKTIKKLIIKSSLHPIS